MSGWKTATIKNREKTDKINQTINDKDRNDEEVKKLSDNAIGMRGYEAEIEDKIAEILQDAEVENGQVLIIEANDTTDSGHGTLFDIKELKENGSAELTQIDSKNGYEGAMAKDVTGYFRDEHGISGFSRVH